MTSCSCSTSGGWHNLTPVEWSEVLLPGEEGASQESRRRAVSFRCRHCGEEFRDADLPKPLAGHEPPSRPGEEPFPWEPKVEHTGVRKGG